MVKARFGLDGASPRTLEEIGRDFRLTRERVRQIEARALHKLRQPYRNYRVRDFAFDKLLVQAGVLKPAPGAIAAAEAVIAEAEATSKRSEAALAHERLRTTPEEGIASELHSLLGEKSMGIGAGRGSVGAGNRRVASIGACAGPQKDRHRPSLLEIGGDAGGVVAGKGKLNQKFNVEDVLDKRYDVEDDVLVEPEERDLLALVETRVGDGSVDSDVDLDLDAELRSLNQAWKRRSPRKAAEQLALMEVDPEDRVRASRLRAEEDNPEKLLSALDLMGLDDDTGKEVIGYDADEIGGGEKNELSGPSRKALDRLQSVITAEAKANQIRLEERETADARSLQVA